MSPDCAVQAVAAAAQRWTNDARMVPFNKGFNLRIPMQIKKGADSMQSLSIIP